ncbi:MAG: hypothetical protein KKF46_07325 [Nanoarchaeota archaeon]|nr:hypothetical protein [Nanoarchaeota archaeon]MBU1322139.1 hypothetical protein [Nanoarchaeota archaeon]MBU1597860.1 hypothetical protein [Nanoarchaeota archaeon]
MIKNQKFADSRLENIVEEEIFGKKEKHIFREIKKRVENSLIRYRQKIIIPISAAFGGATYHILAKSTESFHYLTELFNKDNQGAFSLDERIFISVGSALAAHLLITKKTDNILGGKIAGLKDTYKKQKNFFAKNKLFLSLGTWAAMAGPAIYNTIQRFSQSSLEIKQTAVENLDKIIYATLPLNLILLGGLYGLYSIIGKLPDYAKFIKEKDFWKALKGDILYTFSREKGIHYLEEESKNNNFYANNVLSRIKPNLDEKLMYQKKTLDILKEKIQGKKDIEEQYKQRIISHFKTSSNRELLMMKKSPYTCFMAATDLYSVNPEKAKRIFQTLIEMPDNQIKPEMIGVRNYLYNIYEKDTKKDWQELIECLKKENKMEKRSGAESQVLSFADKYFLKQLFIVKESEKDLSDKFLIERWIYENMKNTGVLVENPLFFYDENDIQTQIFLRNGEHNMQKLFHNMQNKDKKTMFQHILSKLNIYQQNLFSSLYKKDQTFFLSYGYRGLEKNIMIPTLQLHQNIMQRAFKGYESHEERLGVTEHLPPLIKKINELKENHPFFEFETINHGDLFGTNITEQTCFIDPRPKIAHPLYDFTYLALDPGLLSISYDSKKEVMLEEVLKKHKSEEKELSNAIDYYYLHNGLCLTGSQLVHNKFENSAQILSEIMEFSKNKIFEKELLTYFKTNMKTNRLLKLI